MVEELNSNLVYGVNDNGFVVLGLNNYDYSNDNIIIDLLKKYKKVQFENMFNSGIDWLPEGITHIYFGAKFNQPVDNLPSTTKKLVFRHHNDVGYTNFAQPLDYLPSGLEELLLHFNKEYNQPFNNLPPRLKKLFLIGYEYNQPLNNLPDSIEDITIKQFDYNNTHKLPNNLKIIKISEYKFNVENNKIITCYQNIKTLQNNYPNTQFIYKE